MSYNDLVSSVCIQDARKMRERALKHYKKLTMKKILVEVSKSKSKGLLATFFDDVIIPDNVIKALEKQGYQVFNYGLIPGPLYKITWWNTLSMQDIQEIYRKILYAADTEGKFCVHFSDVTISDELVKELERLEYKVKKGSDKNSNPFVVIYWD